MRIRNSKLGVEQWEKRLRSVLKIARSRQLFIDDTTKPTMLEFVNASPTEDSQVFTDDHTSYEGLANHTSVNHSQKQWAVSTALGELAHTNGIESFWAVLKCAYHGTNHKLSKKLLSRSIDQFAGKHILVDADAEDQMALVVRGMKGKRLKYKDLTA